jgi:hypothetical protein
MVPGVAFIVIFRVERIVEQVGRLSLAENFPWGRRR